MRLRLLLLPALGLGLGLLAFVPGLSAAEGRVVVGKVAPGISGRTIDWSRGEISLVTRPPKPDKLFQTEEEYRAWRNDPKVKFARENFRNLKVPLEPDGSFRIENLPAGNYAMEVQVKDAEGGGTAGSLKQEIVIPPPTGAALEPVDLGTLEMPLKLRVGDPAPLFALKTVDDEPLRLEDFRGKLVLLDFWATWCGPCVAAVPHLKELYETYGRDGRFVMVALSLDETPEAARAFAEKNSLPWVQGFVGMTAHGKVLEHYGVTAIPAMFLIDAEGRLIARDLHGAALKGAIEKALGAEKQGGAPRRSP